MKNKDLRAEILKVFRENSKFQYTEKLESLFSSRLSELRSQIKELRVKSGYTVIVEWNDVLSLIDTLIPKEEK